MEQVEDNIPRVDAVSGDVGNKPVPKLREGPAKKSSIDAFLMNNIKFRKFTLMLMIP